MELILLESPMIKKSYGGTRIKSYLNLESNSNEKIGEFWAISAHENGMSFVKNGKYKGLSLKQIYDERRDLFANAKDEKFPLLIKINDIQSPPSIQVHPDDDYALKHENDLGKPEFLIFLETEPQAKMISGHTAKSKEEFIDLVNQKAWDKLLVKQEINKNDFIYNKPGTVHGIEGKVLLVEIQKSSDTTYRLYDYDNRDQFGNKRELHLVKAFEVTEVPYIEHQVVSKTIWNENFKLIEYSNLEYFEVKKLTLNGQLNLNNNSYSLITVLKGNGHIETKHSKEEIQAGDNCIVTSLNSSYLLEGDLELIISNV